MNANNKPVLIYTTFADRASAERVATILVERRLAACVNIISGVTSVYRWDNRVAVDAEVVAVVKTSSGRVDPIKSTVAAEHTYDCPALVVVDLVDGLPDYLAWIMDQTSAPTER